LKVTFLGTGTSQGIPVIGCDCNVCLSDDLKQKRLRVSALIQIDNKNILIDAGPDFRQQMLTIGINHLDAILITHEHNDHIAGIDDVRPFNFRSEKDMHLYAMKRVADAIKTRFPYIFRADPYPGAPRIKLEIIQTDNFQIGEIEITPIPIMHGNLPILGFRIGKFAYLTDVKYIDELQIQQLQGLDYLAISSLQLEKHHSHCTLDETLAFINRILPKKTKIIHMSHTMGDTSLLEAHLPKSVDFAYDGLQISL